MNETQTQFDFATTTRLKTRPTDWPPLWAQLPDTFEAIERGERLAPIPALGPSLIEQLRRQQEAYR